ncbi:hypothetical protein [Stomatohabitans albus]|uniref:hypothetical protein n=1 Tax=Stomatohabitans albus TaxID=3110766 RepID=UPI00300C25E0
MNRHTMLRPPQRWARNAAWISALAGLGPVLWRIHMLIWGAGWDLAPQYRSSPTLVGYVSLLIVVEAAASIAPLGLVQWWGEVWPSWIPRLGGRRISPRFVVTVATSGTALVTLLVFPLLGRLFWATAAGIDNPILQVHGRHRTFLLAHYLFWPLWPIGLWVALFGFYKRWFGNKPS